MLTRRQLLTASAGTSLLFGTGFSALAQNSSNPPGQLILKPIPSTGEFLPAIGLGTNKWVDDGDQETMVQLGSTLMKFTNSGGRVIDTAPSYRSAETALGKLIAQNGIRNAFFLATKVDQEDRIDGLMRMEKSRDNLRTEQIDLMQIHSLRGADAQINNLITWKNNERLRYIGLTTSRTDQFAEMEELINKYPIDFIQLNYSVIAREAEKRLLPLAQEKKIAVMVNLPFQRGRLFKAVADTPLPAWSSEFDCASWAQFFLKFVISHPAVTCAIPGMTKPEHTEDNMGACYGRLPNEEQRARMSKIFRTA